jgi:hypothetical protein
MATPGFASARLRRAVIRALGALEQKDEGRQPEGRRPERQRLLGWHSSWPTGRVIRTLRDSGLRGCPPSALFLFTRED